MPLQTNIKTIPFKIKIDTTTLKIILAHGLGVKSFTFVGQKLELNKLFFNKNIGRSSSEKLSISEMNFS